MFGTQSDPTVKSLFGGSKQEKQNSQPRVYLCVDVDSFFAQCDSRKLGLDNSIPLVSVQWKLCVSVNYAARALGIKNYMLLEEAKRICPHVVVSHADTFKPGESITNPYNTDAAEKFKTHDKNKEKVSLEHYRAEADKIFTILENYSAIVEKASFDEAFLDVTAEATEMYRQGNYREEWVGKMCGGEKYKPETEQDFLLMIGSQIAEKILIDVEKTLNYTVSAGISYNKMLCKLGSGLNKPHGQAIICEKYVLEALSPLNVSKLRNFGKKITGAFEEVGITKLGEVHKLNLQEIQEIVQDERTAKWVYFRARGFDDEVVEPKEFASKSIMSSKSLSNIANMKDLDVVVDLILTELNVRLQKNFENNKMVPKTLNLHYWDTKDQQHRSRIKSIGIDLRTKKEDFLRILKEKSTELVKMVADSLFPCNYLALSIKNFEKSDFHKFEYDLVTYMKNKKKDHKESTTTREPVQEDGLTATGQESIIPVNEQAAQVMQEEKEEVEEEKVECERCKALVPKSGYEAHVDFHTAEDLDRELNPNKKKYKRKECELNGDQIQMNKKSSDKDDVIMESKKVKKNSTSTKQSDKEKINKSFTLENFFFKK